MSKPGGTGKQSTEGKAATQATACAGQDTDGMLAEWGARLFFPIPKAQAEPSSGSLPAMTVALTAGMTATMARPAKADPQDIRAKIRATVAPGATQVKVKITGGGRGMKAIAAHFRYISRQGKAEAGGRGQTLEVEDEQGEKHQGAQAIAELADEWRVSGAYIDDNSKRKEAFNIIYSMPVGTPPGMVRDSAAATARQVFEGHKYVFVLHEDQGAPHVHLAVKADRNDGVRLNPRKAELDRWRAVFARELQDRGINAVATRQPVRAANRNYSPLWEKKSAARGQLDRSRPSQRNSARALQVRAEAIKAWEQIAKALAVSKDPGDVRLAMEAVQYLAVNAPGGLVAARAAAHEVLAAGREPRDPKPGRTGDLDR